VVTETSAADDVVRMASCLRSAFVSFSYFFNDSLRPIISISAGPIFTTSAGFFCYYYAAFNAPCVGHKDDESQPELWWNYGCV